MVYRETKEQIKLDYKYFINPQKGNSVRGNVTNLEIHKIYLYYDLELNQNYSSSGIFAFCSGQYLRLMFKEESVVNQLMSWF